MLGARRGSRFVLSLSLPLFFSLSLPLSLSRSSAFGSSSFSDARVISDLERFHGRGTQFRSSLLVDMVRISRRQLSTINVYFRQEIPSSTFSIRLYTPETIANGPPNHADLTQPPYESCVSIRFPAKEIELRVSCFC